MKKLLYGIFAICLVAFIAGVGNASNSYPAKKKVHNEIKFSDHSFGFEVATPTSINNDGLNEVLETFLIHAVADLPEAFVMYLNPKPVDNYQLIWDKNFTYNNFVKPGKTKINIPKLC